MMNPVPKMTDLKLYIFVFFLLFLSVSLVISTISGLNGGKRISDINKDISALEKQKQALETDIKYEQSDEYVEEKARNELNLIKPGEKVYVVEKSEIGGVEGQNSQPVENSDVLSAKSEKTEEAQKTANWELWVKLFF